MKQKAWQLIEKEENWGKGNDFYNNLGCHCPVTAIYQVYKVQKRIRRAIKKLNKVTETDDIVKWNDAPERTHAQVLAAMKKADV